MNGIGVSAREAALSELGLLVVALFRVLTSIVSGTVLVVVTTSGGIAGDWLVFLRSLPVVVLRRLRRLRAGRRSVGLRLPSRASARLVHLRATGP